MPVLGLPLLLVGLVGLPMVAGIYWLRTRFRRQEVSTLFLWRATLDAQGGGRKKSRLQTPLALLLELLAILLLVLAATSPRVLRAGYTAAVVVVLDDSYSMNAVDPEGESARQRAVAALEDELKSLRQYSVRLIAAGSQPRVLGEPMDRWAEVEAALEGWGCESSSADLTGAIALAGEIGDPRSRLLVLSDHPIPDALREPAEGGEAADETSAEDTDSSWGRLRWVSVGKALPNVALTNAVRSPDAAQGDKVLLEIANHSLVPVRQTLTLAVGASDLVYEAEPQAPAVGSEPTVIDQRAIELAAGETTRLWLSPVGAEGRPLIASLGDDALMQDNRVVLMPPERRLLPVSVDLSDAELNRSVTQAVRASNRAVLASERALLRITDTAAAPDEAPLAGTIPTWTVLFDTGSAEDGAEPQAFLGPFVIDFAHPVAEGLSLNGLVWAVPGNASEEQATPPGRPVVTAGNVVLLSDDERPDGTHQLTWRLRPDRSTVLQSAALPILVWNMIEMRQAERPGLSPVNARPGVPVSIVTRSSRGEVQVERIEAYASQETAAETLPVRERRATFIPDQPGVYEVVAGEQRHRFAVNAGSLAESDLRAAIEDGFGEWDDDLAVVREYRGLAWALGLLVLGVLILHAWWFARHQGGGVFSRSSSATVAGVEVAA
ncbi:vWA domain-containing protein [Algisphaera agarilytica]|uniref:Aerotolerance regulator N-terminal domain-containing protein n=1 Tax=Algisphaera agarilytica TaxID=1385975 RepID=A0A7X0LJJ9_9BACT|nr:VWA domain-containing protein [Algisphaera agarilytica]MBB6428834.1 hypothetical protein [Algisphaera agarilytica]